MACSAGEEQISGADFDADELDEGAITFLKKLRDGLRGVFDELLFHQCSLRGVRGGGDLLGQVFAGKPGWGRIVTGNVEA